VLSLADVVFTLPRRPRTAVVSDGLDGWPDALKRMGIELVAGSATADSPDLVVAASDQLDPALRARPPCLICEGPRAGRHMRGYRVRRFLPLPDRDRPEVLLPLSARAPVRYAFDRSPPSAPWKRIRNRLVVTVLAAGVPPPRRSIVAIASRERRPPFLIAEAARALELPADPEWLLQPASGDPLSRGTFHLFAAGHQAPDWVLKFARIPGYSASFDRDERGLRLAAEAGRRVSAHAPRLLGRFAFEGLHASVETAAAGRSLVGYLGSGAPRRDKVAAIEGIAEWVLEVAAETRSAPERLTPERQRIGTEVLPRWSGHGASSAIVDELPPIPGVLQHNDLGTWNVVIDPAAPASFTVLDWENARPLGFPLWDLWFFLQDALAVLDGVSGLTEADLERREDHAVRLFRGDLPSSRILFEWTRRAAAACGVPPPAVGPLAILCFLHHGLSQDARASTARQQGSEAAALEMPWPRVARRWLEDPALGTRWDRWR
jgi:hypothetical protein